MSIAKKLLEEMNNLYTFPTDHPGNVDLDKIKADNDISLGEDIDTRLHQLPEEVQVPFEEYLRRVAMVSPEAKEHIINWINSDTNVYGYNEEYKFFLVNPLYSGGTDDTGIGQEFTNFYDDIFCFADKKYKIGLNKLATANQIRTCHDLISHDEYMKRMNPRIHIYLDITHAGQDQFPSLQRMQNAFDRLKEKGFTKIMLLD